jgi:hypothetical protein
MAKNIKMAADANHMNVKYSIILKVIFQSVIKQLYQGSG